MRRIGAESTTLTSSDPDTSQRLEKCSERDAGRTPAGSRVVAFRVRRLRQLIVLNTALCGQPLLADGTEIERGPSADGASSEMGSDADTDQEGAENECCDSHT
jgi:hypothetical protein